MGTEAKRRDPERTRRELLAAGQKEIYEQGYRAASVDRILGQTQLTKGAFFHHFSSKTQLALAIIEEVVTPQLEQDWLLPLAEGNDPLKVIFAAFKREVDQQLKNDAVRGMLLGNLAAELAPSDDASNRTW